MVANLLILVVAVLMQTSQLQHPFLKKGCSQVLKSVHIAELYSVYVHLLFVDVSADAYHDLLLSVLVSIPYALALSISKVLQFAICFCHEIKARAV